MSIGLAISTHRLSKNNVAFNNQKNSRLLKLIIGRESYSHGTGKSSSAFKRLGGKVLVIATNTTISADTFTKFLSEFTGI